MNKKTVLGVVIGAAVALGSVGTGTLVTAYAANETVYANGKVYTETQTIQYEEGREYELEVKLSTDTGIAGFQMTFEMPYFAQIVEVRENDGVFNYTQYMHEDSNAFSIAGMSDEDKTEELLFTIVYTLTEEAVTFLPFASLQQCTNTDFNYVEGIAVECADVIVETQEVTRVKGDMNEDGIVDLTDLLIVQRSLINPNTPLNGWQTESAEINGDGIVDLLDCQYIQMYIVGKLDGSLEDVNKGNENPGDTNNPNNPVQHAISYTLVVGNQQMDYTLSFNEGESVVKFMEMYKVYEGVAYSEVLVYGMDTASGSMTLLTAETPLVADAHYRVVLQGGTQSGGGETEAKVSVYVQQRIDGVIQAGTTVKEFDATATLGVLRDSCTTEGYTIDGFFMDEGYSVPVSESEMAAMPLEDGKTYYISFVSIEQGDLQILVEVMKDGNILGMDTLFVSSTDGAATLQERYKEYNGVVHTEVRVYEYTDSGEIVEMSSDRTLIGGAKYRVVLIEYIMEDIVTPVEPAMDTYTNVDNPNQILMFNATEGNFLTLAKMTDDAGNYEITDLCSYTVLEQSEDGNMVLQASSLADNTKEYVINIYTVDLTFRIQ